MNWAHTQLSCMIIFWKQISSNSALNRATRPVHIGFSLRFICFMDWKAPAPAWAETGRSSSNSHRSSYTSKGKWWMWFGQEQSSDYQELNIRVITVGPRGKFPENLFWLSYMYSFTRGTLIWPVGISSHMMHQWDYSSPGSVPHGCLGALWCWWCCVTWCCWLADFLPCTAGI